MRAYNMEAYQVCGIILLVIVAVVGEPLTVESLARRQNAITMDTFIFFNEQIEVAVYYMEKRITDLEEKVRLLEETHRSGWQPGDQDTRPDQPDQPRQPDHTEEPYPEPGPEPEIRSEPGIDLGLDAGREYPDETISKPRPGTGIKPKPVATTMRPTTQKPATAKVTLTPPGPQYDRNCAEILDHGYTYSSEYTIDPDGDGPIEPFTVFCDMDSGKGITKVGHSDEQPDITVNGYENPGSFNLQPIYANGASMQQLGALADASEMCRQYVKYACKNSGIMEVHQPSGLTYAWWVDRNGQKRINFGGAPTDSGKCACAFGGENGDTNTCFLGSTTCNCDHKKAKNQQDEGEFTDKDLLPVMSINLGDTGSKKERGAITLGKFICEGLIPVHLVPKRYPIEEPDPYPEPAPETGSEPGSEPGPDAGVEDPDETTPKQKPGRGKSPKPVATTTTIKPTTQKPATTVRVTTTPPAPQYHRTCAEILNHGSTDSSEYTIDPDGDGPIEPFTVFCDMDSGQGVTKVGHSDEQSDITVNGYENPGSFNLQPTYANGASMEQLGALADASGMCKQYVKYACKNSGIMEVHKGSGLTYAWWVDRNGDKRVNFGGAPTDSGKCGCAFGGETGDTNTCFMGSATCSCDHKKAKNEQDEGEFTDKDLLPVMSINLGDTGGKKEKGSITLGKFICEG